MLSVSTECNRNIIRATRRRHVITNGAVVATTPRFNDCNSFPHSNSFRKHYLNQTILQHLRDSTWNHRRHGNHLRLKPPHHRFVHLRCQQHREPQGRFNIRLQIFLTSPDYHRLTLSIETTTPQVRKSFVNHREQSNREENPSQTTTVNIETTTGIRSSSSVDSLSSWLYTQIQTLHHNIKQQLCTLESLLNRIASLVSEHLSIVSTTIEISGGAECLLVQDWFDPKMTKGGILAVSKGQLGVSMATSLAVMVSDQATCDGSLSLSDFQIAANDFAEKWKKFNSAFPEWLWIDCSNRFGFAVRGFSDGYLSLQNVLFQRSHEEEHGEGISNDDKEPIDDATLISNDDGYRYHFHVVYSPSYRVPVLYFRAHSSDGQPLPLEEIEKNLPSKSANVLLESKWTFITQEEHPYLNRPWYMLHPCGTSEWMRLLLASDDSMATEQYLVSWFSVVGQVFDLKIPFEMLKTVG